MDLWLLRRDAGHLSDLRLPLPALPPKRLVIGLKQAASLGTLNFQAVDSVQSGPTHLRYLSTWNACHFTRIGGLRFNADRRPKGAHRNAKNSLSARVLSRQ